ncbi:MAG TPA: hypothetical protein DCP02_05480 [Actinobacteria bacterium]|nr:hypothetical protein [Actinomycetota bacterium]
MTIVNNILEKKTANNKSSHEIEKQMGDAPANDGIIALDKLDIVLKMQKQEDNESEKILVGNNYLTREKLHEVLFKKLSQSIRADNKDEQLNGTDNDLFRKTLLESNIHIIGSISFTFKVKRAIKLLNKNTNNQFDDKFLLRHIVSSERIVEDRDLGILYLRSSLRPKQMAYILKCLLMKDAIEWENIQEQEKNRLSDGIISRFYRRLFRVSIEKTIKKAVIKIIADPPRGKVATEDQHFIMIIMRLEAYIKSIANMIEKQSDIVLLSDKRKEYQKKLCKVLKEYLGSFNGEKISRERKIIEQLDFLIYEKRLFLQRRIINRIFDNIKELQISGKVPKHSYKSKSRIHSINNSIEKLRKKQIEIDEKFKFPLKAFQQRLFGNRIIRLRRKLIKYNYLFQVSGKQEDFIKKLQMYLKKNHSNALIPNSYDKSLKVNCFNLLRFLLNIGFIGFYIYLLEVPLTLIPYFAIFGIFVFQPIANKFAVLLMSAFIKNNGNKRLSSYELKKEINSRAVQGQYLCAIDLPIYTGKAGELETTIHYIDRNLKNLRNTLVYYDKLGIFYQITSNTSDNELVDKEILMVKKAQAKADSMYGSNRVYFIYLHRNSGTAKKVGNIVASHIFKHHGYTSSDIYTDSGRFLITLDKGPLFDRVYGNFGSTLCINKSEMSEEMDNKKIIEAIIQGERIKIDRKIDFTFFVDNKNELMPASLEKALAIMLHNENKNIGILQPQMSIEDPISEGQKLTSAFLKMMRTARDVHNVKYLNNLHGIYQNMSAYYGKGMIRTASYDYMIMNEVLNLKYVDSHDWQESVFNYTVLATNGNEKISVQHTKKNKFNVLIEKKDQSSIFCISFEGNKYTIIDEDSCERTIYLDNGTREEKLREVIDYINNSVCVGERELISTIGNYTRDRRWLKGDLQMFNTFFSYAWFMPGYHKLHLENIFRRFTNELLLFLWVFINLLFFVILPESAQIKQEVLFILTLYMGVTVFGFAGIDLFLYPIFFEVNNRIHYRPSSVLRTTGSMAIKIIKKIGEGLWQFLIYLLIAWPRILLSMKSAVSVMIAGIDKSVNWGAESNAGISIKETKGRGIPLKKFIKFYSSSIVLGIILSGILIYFTQNGLAYSSVFMPFNMGIIILSMLIGPIIAYFISRKIKTE